MLRSALGTARCLAVSLASTHEKPVAPLPELWQPKMLLDIATCPLGYKNHPQWGTIVKLSYKPLKLVIYHRFIDKETRLYGSRMICPDGKEQSQRLELTFETNDSPILQLINPLTEAPAPPRPIASNL